MIGNLIIDKASSNMSYFLYSIKILQDNSGCISRKEFVKAMADFVGKPPHIGGRENRTLYNKSNFLRYFGFIDSRKDTEGNEILVLTKRGEQLSTLISERPNCQNAKDQYWVKQEDQPALIKMLFDSIMFDSFGRNNCGVKTSSSDVEPPKILFKTLAILGRATAAELYYIFYSLDNGVYPTYHDAINAIMVNRELGKYDYSSILEQWGQKNSVGDCKIIKIFADDCINLIISEEDDVIGETFYKLNPYTTQHYQKEIECLSPVYAPLQMAIHSGNINAAEQWVNETIFGRVSDKSCITVFDRSADENSLAFIQSVLIPAVAKAYNNEKTNHYLVIKNADAEQVAQLFGALAPLLVRESDFTSINNGFSSKAITDEDVYNKLVALSEIAKVRLKKPEVLLPANFHIVSIESETANMSREYDHSFTQCLVDTGADNADSAEKIVVADSIPEDLSVDDLGKLLRKMYDEAIGGKVSAIHMFGLKYGSVIKDKDYSITEIIRISGINDSYNVEVSKGISIYKAIKDNAYGIRFYEQGDEPVGTATETEEPAFSPRKNAIHPLNCILYGAPGTGKTYATAEYALAILENREVDKKSKTPDERKAVMDQYRSYVANRRIVFTTFHQSYGYEDFIQGLRPVSANGGMDFVPVDGVFKQIADTAKFHPEDNYVIIIDEINRANISKVFGELITLIEDDKRWGEVNALQVTLPSGESFKIPNNLYIVGTMNSADKSISLIDTALRRRFEFIEVTPDAALIADPVLRSVLEKLNDSLAKELDSTDLLVGHAYFIGKTQDNLCDIFNRSIIPLLYEYFYDNSAKVKAQLKNALPSDQYEITDGKVGRIKISKKQG